MKIFVLGFILLNALIAGTNACRNEVRRSDTFNRTPTPDVSSARQAYITRTCAPWDGAAITIQLTDDEQDCDDVKTPYFRITIWKGIEDVSGKEFKFPDTELGEMSFQLAKGEYKVAKSGIIRFEESNDSEDVLFELNAEFEDGKTIQGRFKAKWCERRDFCG